MIYNTGARNLFIPKVFEALDKNLDTVIEPPVIAKAGSDTVVNGKRNSSASY